jgi:hypothetical protein
MEVALCLRRRSNRYHGLGSELLLHMVSRDYQRDKIQMLYGSVMVVRLVYIKSISLLSILVRITGQNALNVGMYVLGGADLIALLSSGQPSVVRLSH